MCLPRCRADGSTCLQPNAPPAERTTPAPNDGPSHRAADLARLSDALDRLPDAPAPAAVPPPPPAPAPVKAPPPVEFVPLADPSMLELFREEVRGHSATLNNGLLGLEREPANPQRIEPLMRAAHSLKGASRIVGLDPAVRLAHDLEDAFVAAQAGRIRIASADIDVFLRCGDVLAALGEEDLTHWVTSRQGEVAQLREEIGAIARGEPGRVQASGVASAPRVTPGANATGLV